MTVIYDFYVQYNYFCKSALNFLGMFNCQQSFGFDLLGRGEGCIAGELQLKFYKANLDSIYHFITALNTNLLFSASTSCIESVSCTDGGGVFNPFNFLQPLSNSKM